MAANLNFIPIGLSTIVFKLLILTMLFDITSTGTGIITSNKKPRMMDPFGVDFLFDNFGKIKKSHEELGANLLRSRSNPGIKSGPPESVPGIETRVSWSRSPVARVEHPKFKKFHGTTSTTTKRPGPVTRSPTLPKGLVEYSEILISNIATAIRGHQHVNGKQSVNSIEPRADPPRPLRPGLGPIPPALRPDDTVTDPALECYECDYEDGDCVDIDSSSESFPNRTKFKKHCQSTHNEPYRYCGKTKLKDGRVKRNCFRVDSTGYKEGCTSTKISHDRREYPGQFCICKNTPAQNSGIPCNLATLPITTAVNSVLVVLPLLVILLVTS